jgi:hypothetical protein
MKRLDEEIKRKKDEENRQKLENLKKRDELKRLESEKVEKMKQQEEEKKRLIEKQQQQDLIKKQLEKQRLQQELTNLQLPAHANWAKSTQQATINSSSSGQNVIPLKAIFEQQTLESMEKQRQIMEQQQKHAELQAQSQSTWSSLFRGGKQNPPSLLEIQNEQAQIEQAKQLQEQLIGATKPKQTQMASLLAKQQPPQSTTWAAWGSTNAGNNSVQSEAVNSNFPLPAPTTTTTTNATPFWNTTQETKKGQNHKNSAKNPTQVPVQQQSTTKHSKNVDFQEVAQKVFQNQTQISDEFMKWCHEQLKDFRGAECKH